MLSDRPASANLLAQSGTLVLQSFPLLSSNASSVGCQKAACFTSAKPDDDRSIVVFLGFWGLGYVGLPRVGIVGGLLFTPSVAVLDLVLVFLLFKGDVRLA